MAVCRVDNSTEIGKLDTKLRKEKLENLENFTVFLNLNLKRNSLLSFSQFCKKNVFGAFYGRIDLKNILHEELICSLKFECNFGVGLALF